MAPKIKYTQTAAEDVYAGLVKLIKTELSVDEQWLSRLTATPDTVFELLLESARNERCPTTQDLYRKLKAEERLEDYLQTYKYMGDVERAKLSATITSHKLFLIP